MALLMSATIYVFKEKLKKNNLRLLPNMLLKCPLFQFCRRTPGVGWSGVGVGGMHALKFKG